jgi:hypothetical protein
MGSGDPLYARAHRPPGIPRPRPTRSTYSNIQGDQLTAIAQGTDVLTELNTAVATYPETNVVLELVEVEFDDHQSEQSM